MALHGQERVEHRRRARLEQRFVAHVQELVDRQEDVVEDLEASLAKLNELFPGPGGAAPEAYA